MRPLFRIASIAVLVPIALAFAAGAQSQTSVSPRVDLQPSVVTFGEHATIAVSGIDVRSLAVRLSGSTYADGEPLPWRSLRFVDGAWHGTLPAPAWRGVYPVEFRTGSTAAPIKPAGLFLRVFAPGTRERPSFDRPIDIVRWWVRTVPQATLVAIKAWPRPAFDGRDVRLNRLFVVAYSLPGHPAADDQLGMFVTAFRDGYGGRWRLLDATVQP